jgi:hypothetical protein
VIVWVDLALEALPRRVMPELIASSVRFWSTVVSYFSPFSSSIDTAIA